MLGLIFIIDGDYNAKHSWWGSRVSNLKRKELYKYIASIFLRTLSTGSPTYWLSDTGRYQDLLDFFVHL